MLLDSNILIYGASGTEPWLDAIIAATALVHQIPLVTRNTEDLQNIEGLRLVNPVDSR